MMKKALALAGAGVILLSMAGPSFGTGGGWWGGDDVNIYNRASVINNVVTQASTGYNSVGGLLVCGRIRTGAAGATAIIGNDVNLNQVGCDGCDGDVEIHNNAYVRNNVLTQASSGYNRVGGLLVGGMIRTGAAGATSMVTNFVNTNIVGD